MDESQKMEAPKAKMPGWGIALIVVALILAAVSLAVSLSSGLVVGSGEVVTEERDVSDFNKISLSGAGDVVIEQTEDEEALTVEAEDNIISRISTEVVDGELQIKNKGLYFFFIPTKSVKYTIKVKDLEKVGIFGSGSVTATELRFDRLELDVSGSGDVSLAFFGDELVSSISGSGSFELTGEAGRQEVTISGSGDYSAGELESSETKVEINGSGDALVRVKERLEVSISGSGDVRYYGDPEVNSDISGSGSVNQVE
jgi:hypothetical protein